MFLSRDNSAHLAESAIYRCATIKAKIRGDIVLPELRLSIFGSKSLDIEIVVGNGAEFVLLITIGSINCDGNKY